jgi:hydroxyacylglutathione hydrolase
LFVQIKNKDWIIDRLVVGEFMVNCYIVGWKPTGEAIVVDPGGEVELIVDRLKELNLKVTAVVNTHGHGDHIGGNNELLELTGVPLLVGEKDAPMLEDPRKNLSAPFGYMIRSRTPDKLLHEGDTVQVGGGTLKVLDTPGHSPGSVSLVGDGFVLVGDVLFAGSIGRTDFPYGSMELLLQMIKEKLFPLGDEFIVLPGHESISTIGEERKHNPFLKMGSRLGW